MTPRQLKARLDQADDKPLVLDVREPWELGVCALEDVTHIPMGQIPARLTELDKERDIVVLCHHGVRSQQVANFLARNGFSRLYNLQGGIDAWARDVDPTTPVY